MSRWTRYRLLGAALIAAFALSSVRAAPTWVMRTWQSDVGLPDNTVVGIEQTPDGFLWVATKTGVVRFDGVQFRPSPVTVAGIAGGYIEALLVDRRGRIWVAKERGRVFCVDQGRVTAFGPENGLPNDRARMMVEDGEGALWISYVTGAIACLLDGRWRVLTSEDGVMEGGTYELTTDPAGRLWFSRGSWVGGVRDGKFCPPTKLAVQRIASARSGGIWMCSGSGLFKFSEGASPVKICDFPVSMIDKGPTVLYEDRAGILWIGTREAGLFRYDGTAFVAVPLPHQTILSVKEDQEGNIWVGTRGGGLNQLKPRLAELLTINPSAPFEAIRSLCQDTDGMLWAVIWQKGKVLYGTGQGLTPLSASDFPNAQCVAADPQGGVWIGTAGRGVQRWQNSAVTASLCRTNGLSVDTVSALLTTASGALWVGSGIRDQSVFLQRWDGSQFLTFSLPSEKGQVTALAIDAAGDCWAATANGLLLRVHADVLTDETGKMLAGAHAIRCLAATPDGSLWIGFGGQGLGRLKAGRFTGIRMEQGLQEDYISQIVSDGRGQLWCAGNRGVFSILEKEVEGFAAGLTFRVRSVVYGRNEELQKLQASYDSWPDAQLCADGRILFAMQSGIAVVHTSAIGEAPALPPAVIERVMVSGRTVAAYVAASAPCVELAQKELPLRLPPGPQQVEIFFTAPSFRIPESIGFRYRLKGLDKDWVEAGVRRSVLYQQLPPGDYRFEVSACTGDGVWNKTGASLNIDVLPYFWQTWWFQLLAMMSLLGSVAGIVRYQAFRRMRLLVEKAEREGAVERERGRIARDIHDDLGANLAEIAMLSELAQEDLPVETPARGYLNEIFTRAENNVRTLGEIVWAIKPVNDTLEHFSAYLCKFAQDYLSLAGVRCRLNLPETLPPLPLDSFQRHNMYLTAKEAIHNAVKHGAPTEVVLSIAVDERIVITIEDNGCGCVEPVQESKAGHGSANMRTRMEQIGGTFERRSAAGRGTVVTLTLPLERTQVNS